MVLVYKPKIKKKSRCIARSVQSILTREMCGCGTLDKLKGKKCTKGVSWEVRNWEGTQF